MRSSDTLLLLYNYYYVDFYITTARIYNYYHHKSEFLYLFLYIEEMYTNFGYTRVKYEEYLKYVWACIYTQRQKKAAFDPIGHGIIQSLHIFRRYILKPYFFNSFH